MTENRQAKYAAALLSEFHTDGEAEDVGLLDLLDFLAVAGLKLVPDLEGEASKAYAEALR